MNAEELLADEGVLADAPTIAYQTTAIPPRPGNLAVCAWRGDVRDAPARLDCRPPGTEAGSFAQGVVRADRDREATFADFVACWRRVEAGGRLVLVGENALGIKGTAARVARGGGGSGRVLVARGHARAVVFTREGPGPADPPAPPRLRCADGSGSFQLDAAHGAFARGRLDPGTALLIDALVEREPPTRLVDCCCGIGPLGVAALRRYPQARAAFADADARALAALRGSLDRLCLAHRTDVHWWDLAEEWHAPRADLVLCNPPWHDRGGVATGLARRALARIATMLAPGGRALVVGNRRQPFERWTAEIGPVRTVREEGGYKVLEVGG